MAAIQFIPGFSFEFPFACSSRIPFLGTIRFDLILAVLTLAAIINFKSVGKKEAVADPRVRSC